MYLKTLTLRGFKSFASTTTLNFEPGITCVVGPNGSGKSNVVDALAWVMGEQGAKNLRGAAMADVIFAGTTGRAGLGRAQVSLTIDNTDGTLPIDYAEVTISRTLFRGGGSEYSINGTACRLLDIQELLSDTGMGRQMHVIVGQGQLDTILQAGPMERRGFIEEAAGVLKHRRRKERALRKLDSMEANLLRVTDLTKEIGRQLKPLARQAHAARQAGSIQATVRDAKARLLADELTTLTARRNAGIDSQQSLNQRREQLQSELERAKNTLADAEEQARRGTPRTQTLTRQWQELMSVQAALSTLASLAEDRLRQASTPLPRPTVDIAQLTQRAQTANAEDARALAAQHDANATLQQAIQNRENKETLARQLSTEARELERAHSDRREQVARLVGDVQSARERVAAAKAEVARMDEAISAAAQRTAQAETEAGDLGQTRQDDTEATRTLTTANRERDRARETIDQLLREERETQAVEAQWRARAETLTQSLTPPDSTQELLRLGNSRVLGTVAEKLSLIEGWENAVAALLEPFTDAAVLTDLPAALECREGAARRMVLSEIDTANTTKTATPVEPLPRGCHWASTVVEAELEVRDAITHLLDRAAVAPDLEHARAALRQPAVQRVATKAGEILTRATLRTAGADHASLLRRHAEAEKAREQARRYAAELTTVREQLQRARDDYDQTVKAANQALKVVREADAIRAKEMEHRARISSQLHAAKAEEERLRATREKIAQTAHRAEENLQIALERETAAQQLPQLQDPQSKRHEADAAEDAARVARAEETEARLQLRSAEELSNRAQERARSLRSQVARAHEDEQAWRKRQAARQRYETTVREINRRLTAPLEAAQRCVESVAQQLREAEQERTQATEAASQARTIVDELRSDLLELTDAAHRDQIALQEIQLRYERAAEQAKTELGLDVQTLIAQYGPEIPIEIADGQSVPYVRSEQERRLRHAERELQRLGAVNPLALEEYEALSQRHQFLCDQLTDLRTTKVELLQIVTEVDQRVQEVFADAFADTQKAFASVFSTLFPGGEGKLTLTDPDDFLNTGVEIHARPAGKKITRLSLLSGGERSLAAVALLVAIFKARPSPFYVMDEVEAALDDMNLSRLLEIFKELQDDSQLIVITHQKRTMQIADVLYGVSMKDGVTSVISQRPGQLLAGRGRSDKPADGGH